MPTVMMTPQELGNTNCKRMVMSQELGKTNCWTMTFCCHSLGVASALLRQTAQFSEFFSVAPAGLWPQNAERWWKIASLSSGAAACV